MDLSPNIPIVELAFEPNPLKNPTLASLARVNLTDELLLAP